MKRITDRDFVYVNSANTDIRKTFAKAREEMARKRSINDALADNLKNFPVDRFKRKP